MCLFPLPNTNFDSVAYKKGVKEFSCGACPECLQKRSSTWALRAVMESACHAHNCMITLTYDNFLRDSTGKIIGETPVNPDLKVNQRDIQLFIKRLRKHFFGSSGSDMKYIACAEYGSRTHRAHYHVILFGVKFPDLVPYKRSKRGNLIYMSSILNKLWNHGICTVDSIKIRSSVARYCTKYCAKNRSDKTFMLASQNIGLSEMLRLFNGREYLIDGRRYPIPRVVWQAYISDKYRRFSKLFSYKYVNHTDAYKAGLSFDRSAYDDACVKRKFYRWFRDKDPVYVAYLAYWQSLSSVYERLRPPVDVRIALLPESKYHFYKVAAYSVYAYRKNFIPFPAPCSDCVSAYERYKMQHVTYCPRFTCRITPCPNTASDTKFYIDPFDNEIYKDFSRFPEINSFKCLTKSGEQLIIDL